MTFRRVGSAPSGSNVRQTMIGQVAEIVDRLDTVQTIADAPSRTGGPGRSPQGGHSDPTSEGDRDQRRARLVVAKFNQIRVLLVEVSRDARLLVPVVVGCCFWCSEPTKNKVTMRYNGELYCKSPCEMRARRADKAAAAKARGET